jgi:hypothetical protein
MFLGPRLRAANQAMFDDLARAAGHGGAVRRTTDARAAAPVGHGTEMI